MEEIRVVRPHGSGWSVAVPGAKRASSQHRERYDAVAVARRTLQNNTGGRVEVYDESDEVVEVIEVTAVRNRRVGDLTVH